MAGGVPMRIPSVVAILARRGQVITEGGKQPDMGDPSVHQKPGGEAVRFLAIEEGPRELPEEGACGEPALGYFAPSADHDDGEPSTVPSDGTAEAPDERARDAPRLDPHGWIDLEQDPQRTGGDGGSGGLRRCDQVGVAKG